MNRIQPLPPQRHVLPLTQPTTDEASAGQFMPARLGAPAAMFAPLHYEPNYSYPLLVWLHGPGDDEGQLKRIMPMISLRNYVAAAVRGTSTMQRSGRKAGHTWSQHRAEVAMADERVSEAIETARTRFSIAAGRVFLAGFDCGGTMAFRLAMDHPRQFAGVLSLCGAFPEGRMPLLRLAEARRLPIFLTCGRDSRTYPPAAVCEHLRLFHSAGMQVALRQYPCGHEIAPAMLGDMDRWIIEQVAGSARIA
jgi:phospholipase/carboxylesterase